MSFVADEFILERCLHDLDFVSLLKRESSISSTISAQDPEGMREDAKETNKNGGV